MVLIQFQYLFRVWTHHDQSFLYMLFDYVCGGELFSYLRNAGRFSSSTGMQIIVDFPNKVDGLSIDDTRKYYYVSSYKRWKYDEIRIYDDSNR